ncbi:MAG: squalene/phytoene synthase family protein [Henriciella sp.]|nr:squalene/phytoene synthase family protein [Henriciella sp.]
MTSPASDSLKEIVARLDQRIQTVDEERWLSSRYAPDEARHALIILYAFYYELARVRVVVTDQTMGQIRFQWWRDALEELQRGEARQHDVVLALASMMPKLQDGFELLGQLIDAHEAAFFAEDRNTEPEDQLVGVATKLFGEESAAYGDVAREWAALRRGDEVDQIQPKQRVSSALRPAVAHLRLRHAWKQGRKLSALQKRLSVLCAMLGARV